MQIWSLQTCIPDRGEKPCIPELFTSFEAAEAKAEERLRAEWVELGPYDEDGEPLPYPGSWQSAQTALLSFITDGSWGEWEISCHNVEMPADPVRDAAPDMLAALRKAIDDWPTWDDQDEPVNGGDLVEWFGNWRKSALAAIAKAEGRA